MKKLLIIALMAIAIIGCKKDDEPGSLEITVSYYYNNFQGYKPDVGAKAFLYESKYASIAFKDSMNVIAVRSGTLCDQKGEWITGKHLFDGEANVNGVVALLNVPSGEYFLLVSSKGRWTYSTKTITIKPGEKMSLVKNFYYLHEFDPAGEGW